MMAGAPAAGGGGGRGRDNAFFPGVLFVIILVITTRIQMQQGPSRKNNGQPRRCGCATVIKVIVYKSWGELLTILSYKI